MNAKRRWLNIHDHVGICTRACTLLTGWSIESGGDSLLAPLRAKKAHGAARCRRRHSSRPLLLLFAPPCSSEQRGRSEISRGGLVPGAGVGVPADYDGGGDVSPHHSVSTQCLARLLSKKQAYQANRARTYNTHHTYPAKRDSALGTSNATLLHFLPPFPPLFRLLRESSLFCPLFHNNDIAP